VIWVVISEMGFGSSLWNTLYSRVTSWGRERAEFCSPVRSKESRIELRFGGATFASCARNEEGKTQGVATRESRTKRLFRLSTIQEIMCSCSVASLTHDLQFRLRSCSIPGNAIDNTFEYGMPQLKSVSRNSPTGVTSRSRPIGLKLEMRWGKQPGYVVFAGQKISLERPRVQPGKARSAPGAAVQ